MPRVYFLPEHDILDAVETLDSTKEAGPDEIPSSFFKDCAVELSSPLALLFNLSLNFSYFF
jgi:hypothetical protein